MNRTLNLHFFLRKNKPQADKTVPIYLRITIDGKRADISTKRYIIPERWKPKEQKQGGTTEEVKTFNAFLKSFENEVYDKYKDLIESGVVITSEILKNRVLGINEKPRYLVEIFEAHNRQIEDLLDKDYSKPTLTKYETTLEHLKEFLRWKYKVSDINIKDLKYEFLTDFEFYLKSKKSIGHNTTAKYIKNTKKVVNDCLFKGWLEKNPFLGFKIAEREVEAIFLTQEELDTVMHHEFQIKRIAQVRDIFIFSCYTGLSFIDVANLTPKNISIGIDGEKWIFTSRQKTKKTFIPSNIPLLQPALEIIEKYKDNEEVINRGKLLPILSNQKMNAYLKEVADLCGINKEFTFHSARHTFATTVTLTNGVSIESVSKMLGHKKLQTTQRYARILDKKVSNDMDSLRKSFKLEPVKTNVAN